MIPSTFQRPLPACLLLSAALALGACKPATPAAGNGEGQPGPASAATPSDPKADVLASMDKFLAARSFHASMHMQGAQDVTSEMDYVAPDRYRIVMPIGTQVIVGDTMYIDMEGRHSKVPLPEGSLSEWRNPLNLDRSKSDIAVEYLGREPVGDTLQARKYRVSRTQPQPSEMMYWIDDNDLPLRILNRGESQGKPYTVTLDYSRFNDTGIEIPTPTE